MRCARYRHLWAGCAVTAVVLATAGNGQAWFPIFLDFTCSEGLANVLVDDHYGYIDKTGKLIIAPRFSEAGRFSEGLARVKVDSLWGFIDKTGTLRIEAKFEQAEDFADGVALVQFPDTHRWAFLDRSGAVAVDVGRFIYVRAFHEGRAWVQDDDGQCGFIDRSGNLVIRDLRGEAEDFADGLAVIEVGGKSGYIDVTGKVAIDPAYTRARSFSEGLAYVVRGGTRRVITNPRTDEACEEIVDGQPGYLEKSGRFWTLPGLIEGGPFSGGFAPVYLDGKWGLADPSGRMAIEAKFAYLRSFSEGLACARQDDKAGYLDAAGTFVIPPRFDKGWDFSEGMAAVGVDGKIGYIDRTGRYLWTPTR